MSYIGLLTKTAYQTFKNKKWYIKLAYFYKQVIVQTFPDASMNILRLEKDRYFSLINLW